MSGEWLPNNYDEASFRHPRITRENVGSPRYSITSLIRSKAQSMSARVMTSGGAMRIT